MSRITDIDDSNIHLWCYGSASSNQSKSVFKPVYTRTEKDKRTKKMVERTYLGKPRPLPHGPRANPFTWAIAVPSAPDLLKARGVKLASAGKLTAASRATLKKLRPYKIHRF